VLVTTIAANYSYYNDATKKGVLTQYDSLQLGSEQSPTALGLAGSLLLGGTSNIQGSGFLLEVQHNPDLLVVTISARQSYITILAQLLAIITGVFSFGRSALVVFQLLTGSDLRAAEKAKKSFGSDNDDPLDSGTASPHIKLGILSSGRKETPTTF